MLKIFNSLTRKKETFTPIHPQQVGMYVCGVTVDDYCHIGHARVMIFFDVVLRWLMFQGYAVNYVRNITDIDDKIIRRAQIESETPSVLAARFIKAMHEDLEKLRILKPQHEPLATKAINRIINMIQMLIDKNFAYVVPNGDVYYDVSNFKEYGKLSNKNLSELQIGSRSLLEEYKDHPLDFVLWKRAKPEEPGWLAPWGLGRPGWHIECSAMSAEYLGYRFDIHGGGVDLKFPHHENEIAQSEAISGQPHVNFWMHNGFVEINNAKMSKSAGNTLTIRELLKSYHPEVLRFFILSSHYRNPLYYKANELLKAHESLTRLYMVLRGLSITPNNEIDNKWLVSFTSAMEDDFNTPMAIGILFNLAHELNKLRHETCPNLEKIELLGHSLHKLCNLLGLMYSTPEDFLQWQSQICDNKIEESTINRLIKERATARIAKDWATADKLRNVLESAGIILEDTNSETIWRRR